MAVYSHLQTHVAGKQSVPGCHSEPPQAANSSSRLQGPGRGLCVPRRAPSDLEFGGCSGRMVLTAQDKNATFMRTGKVSGLPRVPQPPRVNELPGTSTGTCPWAKAPPLVLIILRSVEGMPVTWRMGCILPLAPQSKRGSCPSKLGPGQGR